VPSPILAASCGQSKPISAGPPSWRAVNHTTTDQPNVHTRRAKGSTVTAGAAHPGSTSLSGFANNSRRQLLTKSSDFSPRSTTSVGRGIERWRDRFTSLDRAFVALVCRRRTPLARRLQAASRGGEYALQTTGSRCCALLGPPSAGVASWVLDGYGKGVSRELVARGTSSRMAGPRSRETSALNRSRKRARHASRGSYGAGLARRARRDILRRRGLSPEGHNLHVPGFRRLAEHI